MELLKAVNAQLATMEHSDVAMHERARIRAVVSQLAHRVKKSYSHDSNSSKLCK